MGAWKRRASLIVFAACIASGCLAADEDALACSAYLGSYRVVVASTTDAPIDEVSAGQKSLVLCRMADDENDAGADHAYWCHEQDGGGEYKVQVKSGDQVWAERVKLAGNACHVDRDQTVEIALTSATAN